MTKKQKNNSKSVKNILEICGVIKVLLSKKIYRKM